MPPTSASRKGSARTRSAAPSTAKRPPDSLGRSRAGLRQGEFAMMLSPAARCWRLLAALLICLLAHDVGLAAERRGQPNVILILADDLGWSDVGCYGQRKIRTPSLDRLAARGMR